MCVDTDHHVIDLPKKRAWWEMIDFYSVLDQLVSLDFHNSEMKVILSTVKAGFKDLVLIVSSRKQAVYSSVNSSKTDFAAPNECRPHRPIVLRPFNSLETGVGVQYILENCWTAYGIQAWIFLGQRKLWIMFPRSWRYVRQARTLSWKVTCSFPECKSRESMLGNHVNDYFGLKRVFFGLRLYYFYF